MYGKKKMLLLAVEIYIFLGFSLLLYLPTSQKIIARIIQRISESLFPIAFGIKRDKFESENLQSLKEYCFNVFCWVQ